MSYNEKMPLAWALSMRSGILCVSISFADALGGGAFRTSGFLRPGREGQARKHHKRQHL
ncbi:MAG: hypothetical protein IKG87_02865 [Clostridia bacterium]|nr:hypothetical protein [Clostridia bacterium]